MCRKRTCPLASAALVIQLSLIGWSEDVFKFCKGDLAAYPVFLQFGFTGRLAWSKDVTDKPQLIIAAHDTHYDSHSSLRRWLECHYELDLNLNNEFMFAHHRLDDPICIKDKIPRLMRSTLNSQGFVIESPVSVGTHSVRKSAVTFARGAD